MNIKKIENTVSNWIHWSNQPKSRSFVCENCNDTVPASSITAVWGSHGRETPICKKCFLIYIRWLKSEIETFEKFNRL